MRFTQPTPEQERLWEQWIAERPESIRAIAARFNPWTLYLLKPTGQRVYVLSFNEPEEDGRGLICASGRVTCRVGVSGEFNLVTFERDVFGVDPDNLEECDLPKPGEQLGTLDLPINVVKNMRDQYQEGGVPGHVMLDLITRYPLKRGGQP